MKDNTGHFIDIKVIVGAVVFGIVVFSALVAILWSLKSTSSGQAPSTAILKIIEAPTQTPLGMLASATPTPTPSITLAAPTPVGDRTIAIGNYVQVNGTGGDGLRLHNEASVSSKVNYIAIEAEIFIVKDGPVDANGYIWWKLEDPYTNIAAGWGVANYLKVVQNP